VKRFLRRPDVVFAIGPWVPIAVLLVAIGLVGAGLSLLVLPPSWAWLGIALALLTAARVRSRTIWVLVLLLVVGRLVRDPAGAGLDLLLLVAGLHLLVALTLHAAVLPLRGRLQLAALLRPARTFCLIQVPCQVLAVVVLLLAGRTPVLPLASAVGGLLLVALALSFALLHLRRGEPPLP
jgi:hypothetical protein